MTADRPHLHTCSLWSQVSTLEILNVDTVSSSNVSDDRTFAMRQATRHVCGALKKYFETHLIVKAEEVHRSHVRSDGSSPLQEVPIYKVTFQHCCCCC